MPIAEAAAQTGYSAETLRFYEREGLLPNIRREGGKRRYSPDDLRTLRLVDCLKKTGMPLREIRRYLALIPQGERSLPQRLEMMRRQQESVGKQLDELQAFAEHIAFKVWLYETALKEGLNQMGDIDACLERYRRETGHKARF